MWSEACVDSSGECRGDFPWPKRCVRVAEYLVDDSEISDRGGRVCDFGVCYPALLTGDLAERQGCLYSIRYRAAIWRCARLYGICDEITS